MKEVRQDGELIYVDNGLNLKATLSTFGAGLVNLYYDEDPMILEFKQYDDYKYSAGYFNKTLGCVAGRIPCKGNINGKEYNLVPQFENGDFSLHGGHLKSLSFKEWKAEIKENRKEMRIIFKIKTKNKENGFIGKANIKIIYVFSLLKNDFKILFKANALDDTLLNLSNHIYWNFARSKDLGQYYLKFDADRVAHMRDDLLFNGVIDIPPYLDFRRMRKIKPVSDFIMKNVSIGTIDNTFLFTNNIKPVVILKNEDYTLKLKTNYPAMNIYLDNSLSVANFKNRDDFTYMRGIALEPQLFVLDQKSITFLKGEKYDYKLHYSIKRSRK